PLFFLFLFSLFSLSSLSSFHSQQLHAEMQPTVCQTEIETLSSAFQDQKNDGTLWSKTTPLQSMTLSFYPERNKLPGVNGRAAIDIPFALASPEAPLVFIQSGLGGTGKSAYNYLLMGLLHQAGLNVVSIPSQYFWRMALATSPNLRPGNKQSDLDQLSLVYQRIRDNLENLKLISVNSKNHFVGVSNGGYNGIQIASQQLGGIAFEKFVVINPPLDLTYGIKTLDTLFVRGKKDISSERYNDLMGLMMSFVTEAKMKLKQIVSSIRQSTTPAELRYLISRQLIESVQEIATISQLIDDQLVFKKQSLNDRLAESRRWSFQDYQNRILIPYFANHQVTEQHLFAGTRLLKDLKTIQKSKNLLMLHSMNDFISNPADILEAQSILKSNAVVAPCGGHVGALSSAEFQRRILSFLK
ncbi:MAG: hypothetical protein ACK5WZ_03075, partial [Pseudobdellovibrionaceae bacterium]